MMYDITVKVLKKGNARVELVVVGDPSVADELQRWIGAEQYGQFSARADGPPRAYVTHDRS